MQNKTKYAERGSILILSIVFTFIFISIMIGIFDLFISQNRLAQKTQAEEIALPIAEAGINYYRWHLTQDKNDYVDGTGEICEYPLVCGPYLHDYYDPLSGEKIGEFEISITPPPIGSTLVKIKSTGWLNDFTKQSRTIEAKYGIPSLAAYAFLTDSDTFFGVNEIISGHIHSNGGIRMDGVNDSIVSSAQSTYTCDEVSGCNPSEEKPGVWGDGLGSSFWQFPVPFVDLNDIDLEQMRIDAQTSGVYYPDSDVYDPINGVEGYRIVFNNDGTFDVYTVDELKNAVQQYGDDWSAPIPIQIADELKEQTFLTTEWAPTNGIIFIEDNVWVEGEVNGRFTLVSAKLTGNPDDYTTIRINDNITYINRDGSNILGLIAEKDIKVPKYAPDILTIDAIMLAQNGRVFRNRYLPPSIKISIEVYGSIITHKEWAWRWCSGNPCTILNVIDGYRQTTVVYDNNAAFSPPPYFPNTGKYTFISWEEKVAGQP
ncbi:MAG: hypothetical protein ABIC82_04535 [bacterium]